MESGNRNQIEFDPAKSAKNIALRGLSFSLAAEFDFESALIVVDDRREYGKSGIGRSA